MGDFEREVSRLGMMMERLGVGNVRDNLIEMNRRVGEEGENLNISGSVAFLKASVIYKVLPGVEQGDLRREFLRSYFVLREVRVFDESASENDEKGLLIKMEACIEAMNLLKGLQDSSRIGMEYGPWVPAPIRENPRLGWDLSEELLWSSPPAKYSRMIWRQEYYWRKSTGEYLHRGFWATSSFRDPAMVKSEDADARMVVGGEIASLEEVEIPLKDLLARAPPRFGAYALWEGHFLSFIQEFLPMDGEMFCFRSRWQLCYNVPVDEAWETVGHRGLAEGRRIRREQRRRARLYRNNVVV